MRKPKRSFKGCWESTADSRCGGRRAGGALLGLTFLAAWLLAAAVPSAAAQFDLKNVQGVVLDRAGRAIPGARVFVRDMDANITRTLTTDASGLYRLNGLSGNVDFEIYAVYDGTESEKRYVSRLLNRRDNVLNLSLDVALSAAAGGADGPSFETFDRVQIHGSFELPSGVQAPIPAVLLLHGYGETRGDWAALQSRLLENGYAVLAIDLRGHGESRFRGQDILTPDPSWRRDPLQFPLDLAPAINWLKTQPRLASDRIIAIGFDVGANLALVAGGRFREVATVVALNPDPAEALALAGTAREFTPPSALLLTTARESAEQIRGYVTGPSRITLVEAEGGAASWLRTGAVMEEIVRWLRDVY